jgi:hypothetical protein
LGVLKEVSICFLVLALPPILPILSRFQQQRTDLNLKWAFPLPDNALPPDDEDISLHQLPGSAKTYPQRQINPFNPPDWFPEEHSQMPLVVRRGRGKSVQACSYCHLASGLGHPQSANLIELSVTYFMR